MTNTDRAALVIAESITRDSAPAHEIVADLEHAGLLMPDLPEPTEGADGFFSWGTIAIWNPKLGLQWAEFDDIYPTTPAELREEAYALLAAADYAERNQE